MCTSLPSVSIMMATENLQACSTYCADNQTRHFGALKESGDLSRSCDPVQQHCQSYLHHMLAERLSWFSAMHSCPALLTCIQDYAKKKQEGSAHPLVLFSFLMRSMTELCHS